MAKANCQFSGSGGQYFGTVFIHLIILGTITFGLYSAWAWVRLFKLKASHTTMNNKPVTFTGTGGELFLLFIIQGLLTVITLGLYFPWALCTFFRWKTQNTLVGEKPSAFTGTGGSLFLFYLVHLLILPILTLGLYFFWGFYRLYAWKEEHTRYGGEKTSFGAGFGAFFGVTLVGYILNTITLSLFTPWFMSMLFRWQISGLAVGDETKVEHFPPVKTNVLVVLILIIIGLIPFLALVLFIRDQASKKDSGIPSQVLRMKIPIPKPSSRPSRKPLKKAKIKPAPKSSKPKVAAPSKIKKPVKVAASSKVVAPTKVATSPARSSAPPGEVDYEFEMKRLDRLLKLDAKNADAIYNRGWLNEYNGNLISAEKDYSQAIQLNRKLEDAYFNRGLTYIEMKKYEKAVSDFTEFLKMKPRSVDAYCNRGNAYFKLGKRNFALRDYDTALGMDPNDADLYFNRALVHLNKGNEPNAMADFRKAANLGLDRASQYLKSPTAKSEAISSAPSKTPSKISTKTPGKATIKTSAKTSTSGPKAILKKETPFAGTASGKIRGVDFKVEQAGIVNGILTLRQGSDFFPDYAVLIFLFLKEGEKAEGRTFNITKSQGFGSPQIHMKWKQEGQNTPKTEIFMKDYTMRLAFGKRENGILPGKISLSLPDKFQSFVSGTFFAEIK